jgi:hypothetical protein
MFVLSFLDPVFFVEIHPKSELSWCHEIKKREGYFSDVC